MLAVQRPRDDIFQGFIVEVGQTGIQIEFRQALFDAARGHLLNQNARGRMTCAELLDQRPDGRQRRRHDAEAHRALQAFARFTDVLNQRLPVGKNALCPDEYPLALRREAPELLIPFDNADAQFAFELVQTRGQRGLRDVAGHRRAGKVLLARKGGQIAQLSYEHARQVSNRS